MKAAELIVRLLLENHVDYVFGVPGDTSMTFHHALEKFQDELKYVSCRDERHAVYMADTYARFSGKPGIVDVPSGGGLLYALPGLSEATASSIPVICFSSDISMNSEGTGALTELKQEEVSRAVTKWNTTIKQAAQIPRKIDKAFRIATGGRPGAIHISIPENIFEKAVSMNMEIKGDNQSKLRNSAHKEDLHKVYTMLKQSKKPVIIAGGGVHASQAHKELEQLAKNYYIPVATSVNGKGSLHEGLNEAIGVVGVNGGTEETNNIIKNADFVLVLGSKLNSVTTVAKTIFKHSPKVVQVDISEEILNLNINADIAIMCDIKSFLQDMYQMMKKKNIKLHLDAWMKEYQEIVQEKCKRIHLEVTKETERVNPGKVVDVLNNIADDHTIFVIDAGTQTPYMAANYQVKQSGRSMVFDRGHGNLGYALSAAIGARLAIQHAKVISMFGDGSFAMSVGELETVSRLGLPIIFIHFENNSYGWIKKLHQLYFNERYIGVDFKPIDACKIAEGFGIRSRRVEKNEQVDEVLNWAMVQEGPVLLDIAIEEITELTPPVTNWREDILKDPQDREALTY